MLTVLDGLLLQRNPQEGPFRYLETHCGKGLQVLGKEGGWRQGIGRLAPIPLALSTHPYFQLASPPGGSGGVYLGSWLLVALHLQSLGIEFQMHLYDVSPEVKKYFCCLGASGSPKSPIVFLPEDGFQAVRSTETWDLVLVDPPFYPDAEKDKLECSRLPALLERRCRAFLIWYPLSSEQEPSFDLARGHQALEIIWEKRKGSSMAGCGVMLGGRADLVQEDLFPQLELLAERLGAMFRWKKGMKEGPS